MNWILIALGTVIYLGLSFFCVLYVFKKKYRTKEQNLYLAVREKEKEILDRAKSRSRTIAKEGRLQAKEIALKMKNQFEQTSQETRKELLGLEKHVTHREKSIEKKEELLLIKENKFKQREELFNEAERQQVAQKNALTLKQKELQKNLEKSSKLTISEAKTQLKESLFQEVHRELATDVRILKEETLDEAQKKAKHVIATAIGRYAGETASEKLMYAFHLPSDDLKGKIIGREGRNIRAIEAATGVDLIVDDTPETVTISSFDPIRREETRQLIERLIQDGRIHPARIEEMAHKVRKEMAVEIKEAGNQAAFELDIHDIHPEIIKIMGSLKFRTSYQQNQLSHSVEVGFLAGAMASEIGGDVRIARRAGFLHDVGKALSHKIEGPHAVVGADFLKKYGERETVTHPVRAHHEDVPLETMEDHLVQAADTLSGARPGARRENLERYVKRLEDLEKVATSFEFVDKAYAIQAGREIRVMINNQRASDEDAVMLSREISKKIEEELNYPGQVKVIVIRETRAIAVAK